MTVLSFTFVASSTSSDYYEVRLGRINTIYWKKDYRTGLRRLLTVVFWFVTRTTRLIPLHGRTGIDYRVKKCQRAAYLDWLTLCYVFIDSN